MGGAAGLAGFAIAITFVLISAIAAYTSSNAIKRVVAVLLGLIGAVLVAALVGAPPAATLVGVALMFGYAVLGIALTVRAQESYGSIEVADLDAADDQTESSG